VQEFHHPHAGLIFETVGTLHAYAHLFVFNLLFTVVDECGVSFV